MSDRNEKRDREPVLVPGGRDVRGSLDATPGATSLVVACPPHPQHGGSRSDQRLTAVAADLNDRGVDCLRFDYGPWDEGRGERTDAANAVAWGRERYDRVGLFGFSFGAAVSILVAAEEPVAAVAALAPPERLGDADVAAAVEEVTVPGLVMTGTRDTTVESGPVVERARTAGWEVIEHPADHFFLGQIGAVTDATGPFFGHHLTDE